ncbi:hypothetical protein INR49_001076 [Caranx melampygus]|nr:hypothetical protein INR49_001076 [Caranx melampygus]
MGLCESMRGWRWRGRGLGTLVGVMLLGLSLAQSVPPKTVCAANVAQQNLPQPEYQDIGDNTDEGFMATFVQSFLHTVQPNTFPKELILRVVNNVERVLSDQDFIKDALVYEVGFLVCAAIGIVYIILMPIVGFFLACCRCCGNCGGKMYQKQTSSIHCRRRALYWSAFVTTVIILAGNICMFKSNENLKVSVEKSPMQFNTTIRNINNFLTSVPQQLDYVVQESDKTIQEVTRNLDDIGHQLGTKIQAQLQPFLIPALHPVSHLNQETRNASVQLDKVNASLVELQSSVNILQANVTTVRNRISKTLSNSNCVSCEAIKPALQALNVDTSITVENYINSIPQMVVNDTRDVVQKSKQQLSDIQTQLSQVTSQLPSLSNISGTLDTVSVEISKVTPEIERAEQIRWAVCVALCCVVLLVVVCNVLGLLLGPMGLKPKADPTSRSCMSDCGGTFLMIDCEKNQPLWTTLHLNESIDLGEFLNASKFTEEIRQQFENTDITLSTITLLSPEVEKQLRSFSSKAQSFDSTAVTQKMNNISRINLNPTADKLDNLANDQTNNVVKNDLRQQAKDLREIQTSIDTTIIPQVITQQLGRCWPVAGALNSMETIVCSRVVESLLVERPLLIQELNR